MHKKPILIVGVLAGLCSAGAKDLQNISLLYVGSERTWEVLPFLKKNVGHAEVRDRHRFKPADAAGIDVVMLDWPQKGNHEDIKKLNCHMGEREN